MAYSYLAHVSAGSIDSGSVTTGAIDTTGADLLVLEVSSAEVAAAPTISDSKSNTWTGLTVRTVTGQIRGRLFYSKNPTVGSGHTFTATGVDNTVKPSLAVAAFSGGHLTAPADQENGAFNTGTSQATGSITPSEDNCLIIAGASWDANSCTASINSSMTITDQTDYSASNRGVALAYKIQTTAAAINPTWSFTNSEYIAVTIASFKASAGGGGGPTATRDLTTLLCGQ